MLGEVYGGISAFKSLMDIAKGLKDIKDVTARNAAIIELQKKIPVAQEAQSSLIEKVRALEEEVARLKKWDADKHQYKLTKIGTGAVAFAPKPDTDLAKTPHWICAKCYDRGERSFLQYQGRTPKNDENIYKCGSCKTEVRVHWKRNPESVAETENPPKPAGDECPKCKAMEFRMESSKSHPIFGEVGAKLDSMKCSSCGHTEDRTRDP